ncbi:MAG TPA: polysaccharide deacetylase family protein [Chryseosolibacter sp.]
MTRLVLICTLLASGANAQEIAITFDDAPTADGPLFSGEERTQRIIEQLRIHEVTQVAFFVITGNINAAKQQRLISYTKAGHLLANHSHTHPAIGQVGVASFIRDVATADSILASYPGYNKWFRYPFLNEGGTELARDSIRAALKRLHLSNGYVTIDNYDWYLNHLLQVAKEAHRKIDEGKLRKIYIDHIYSSILFYDKIARTHLGRSPKHVLLLHENDLSALFVGDLIQHLRQNGWKIISPRESYDDPIAQIVPDVLFNGQGRVAAIARRRGVPARDLVQPSEDEEYLERLVAREKVFD